MPNIQVITTSLPAALTPARVEPAPLFRPLFVTNVPAGFPSPAEEYLDGTLDLNEYLVRNRTATFYFRVSGSSMRDEGINDGDLLVVDRSINPKHGHIVVASVNGDFTVKKLFRRAGVTELRPGNPEFKAIRFNDDEELLVWGVVSATIKQFRV